MPNSAECENLSQLPRGELEKLMMIDPKKPSPCQISALTPELDTTVCSLNSCSQNSGEPSFYVWVPCAHAKWNFLPFHHFHPTKDEV